MRTSQQADIFVVVPNPRYVPRSNRGAAAPTGANNERTSQAATSNPALIIPLGFAQSIRIDDNFNAQTINVLGTPTPIIHPGYQMTTINIEKATIDGYSFRNLGGFNPLWAHIGSTYLKENQISLEGVASQIDVGGAQAMYPFMFILAVKDRVSNSFSYSNFPELASGNPQLAKTEGYSDKDPEKVTDYTIGANDGATANLIGTYVCVINTVSTAIQANNAIIMDNISAYARPLNGTWMNAIMRSALDKQGKNGMDDSVYSPQFGYNSREPINLK